MFRNLIRFALPFAALPALAQPAAADTITLVSDANTLGAATTPAAAQAGDTSGATFVPVLVGGFGTNTGIPANSPSGTTVINIAPGDGEYGFFRDAFTLPVGYANAAITGAASIDDATVVYLNGHALTDASHDVTFSSVDPSFFNAGTNYLDVSDLNTGGGPSGGGFYAYVTFDAPSAVPEPASWAMMIAGAGLVGGALRRGRRTALAIG